MSQEQVIIAYLKDVGDWVLEGKITGIQTRHGFIGFRGPRDVRKLIHENKVEKGLQGKLRVVKYKEPIQEVRELIPKLTPEEESDKILQQALL